MCQHPQLQGGSPTPKQPGLRFVSVVPRTQLRSAEMHRLSGATLQSIASLCLGETEITPTKKRLALSVSTWQAGIQGLKVSLKAPSVPRCDTTHGSEVLEWHSQHFTAPGSRVPRFLVNTAPDSAQVPRQRSDHST